MNTSAKTTLSAVSTSYAQAVTAVGYSLARAKLAGGADHYSLSTVRVQDLRRFVYAVIDERPALERPEPPTKTRMAEWLVKQLRCAGCDGAHQHTDPCDAGVTRQPGNPLNQEKAHG